MIGNSKGIPAGNQPVEIGLEAGKVYSWCQCGRSKTQTQRLRHSEQSRLVGIAKNPLNTERTSEYYSTL
jgi:hypothetical protein